jgi:hypothetical protein
MSIPRLIFEVLLSSLCRCFFTPNRNQYRRTQSSILIGFERKQIFVTGVPDNHIARCLVCSVIPMLLRPIREASGCHFERSERSFFHPIGILSKKDFSLRSK